MAMEDIESLAARLGAELTARGWRLACAESCTGGWLAKCVTDVAGSSGWFDRGFVTYSNEAKMEMLDVSLETLDLHGAVSAATAEAMVSGALRRSRAELAVAITGVAGPGGGTEDKPVGLVWLAWAVRGHAASIRCAQLVGDRRSVREQSVRLALEGLLGETGIHGPG